VLEVRPDQLVSYNSQLVAFYDFIKKIAKIDDNGDKILDSKGNVELVDKVELFIHIQNSEDRYAVVKRKAGFRRVKNKFGDTDIVEEVKLYKRAYDTYLSFKNRGGVIDVEKEALRKEVTELRNAAREEKPAVIEGEVTKTNKSAKDLKNELDAKGIEYKGNASKEALQELLANQ